MPTALLGRQGHQQEIPIHQENGDEKGDGSESVVSELEQWQRGGGWAHTPELRRWEPPKKQKLTDGSDPEISGIDNYFIH